MASLGPESLGTSDGGRFTPVWPWGGSEVAFLVADCFLKTGDPLRENSVSGLAMRHIFVMRIDGVFSRLTPWKHEQFEGSPPGDRYDWGSPRSSTALREKLPYKSTNPPSLPLESGDIAYITPKGFDHFYEIASGRE